MELKLNQIVYYGRYYPSKSNEYVIYWWLNISDYRIYSTDELLLEYGYDDVKDIRTNDSFIPMFQVNMFDLEQKFFSLLPASVKRHFCAEKQHYKLDDDAAFKSFVEKEGIFSDWKEYEYSNLYRSAQNWCEKHGITYR